jgi:hypothetical protein
MPPIIMAIELVVPVIGRSYSPAFLGWFSAMLYSLYMELYIVLLHSGHTGLLGPLRRVLGLLHIIGNSYAKLFCFPASNSQASIPWRNAYARAGEERGWSHSAVSTTGAHQDEASCVRMMRSSSHCESR